MDKILSLDLSRPIRVEVTDGSDNVYRLTLDTASFEHDHERKKPPVVLQCADAYGDKRYNRADGECGMTFCQAGCLVCSYNAVARWAGYTDDPVTFAWNIQQVGAFRGCEVGHPHRITDAYPMLVWHNRGDEVFYSPRYRQKETSFVNWDDRPADRTLVYNLLQLFPVVAKVDYKPATAPVDQHFVVLYRYIWADGGGLMDDCLIMDPMRGLIRLSHYFNPDWYGGWMEENDVSRVERTLLGLRILHITSTSDVDTADHAALYHRMPGVYDLIATPGAKGA